MTTNEKNEERLMSLEFNGFIELKKKYEKIKENPGPTLKELRKAEIIKKRY